KTRNVVVDVQSPLGHYDIIDALGQRDDSLCSQCAIYLFCSLRSLKCRQQETSRIAIRVNDAAETNLGKLFECFADSVFAAVHLCDDFRQLFQLDPQNGSAYFIHSIPAPPKA